MPVREPNHRKILHFLSGGISRPCQLLYIPTVNSSRPGGRGLVALRSPSGDGYQLVRFFGSFVLRTCQNVEADLCG